MPDKTPASEHPLHVYFQWLAVLLPVAFAISSRATDAVGTTIAIAFLARTIIYRDVRWLSERWLQYLIALWLLTVVRAIFTENPSKGLQESILWFRYILLAAAIGTSLFIEPLWRRRMGLSLAVVSAFLALDSIYQFFTDFDIFGVPIFNNNNPELGRRTTASIGRPYAGSVIAWISIPGILGLYGLGYRATSLLLALVCFVAVLLSGERMALIFLIATFMLSLPFCGFSKKALGIGALVTAATLATIFIARPELYERQISSTINNVRYVGATAYGIIWKRALAIAAEHPLLGVGVGQFRDECKKPQYGPYNPATIPTSFYCHTHPHHNYLEWLVETGIVGLSLFLLAMGTLFRRFWVYAQKQPLNLMFAGAVIMLAVRLFPFVTSPGLMRAWAAVPMWMMMGYAFSFVTGRPDEGSHATRQSEFKP